MRNLMFIFLITCVCAGAAEPELYKDAWLNIEYYNAKDVYNYKGKDTKLLEYKKMLRSHKVKKGIFVINKFSKRSYELIVITELSGMKVSSCKDFIKWAAKTDGNKKQETYTYRWVANHNKADSHSHFDTPPKPEGYEPGKPLERATK